MNLILIRGISGSGKTFKANRLVESYGYDHFEADMFFIQSDGSYKFDFSRLTDAHRWCMISTELSLKAGRSVVVANSFLAISEMMPYVKMAEKYSARLGVIECSGSFNNIHNVSKEAIERQKLKWQSIL